MLRAAERKPAASLVEPLFPIFVPACRHHQGVFEGVCEEMYGAMPCAYSNSKVLIGFGELTWKKSRSFWTWWKLRLVGWKSFASEGRYLAIYIPALKPPRGHGGRAKLWTYGVAALP